MASIGLMMVQQMPKGGCGEFPVSPLYSFQLDDRLITTV